MLTARTTLILCKSLQLDFINLFPTTIFFKHHTMLASSSLIFCFYLQLLGLPNTSVRVNVGNVDGCVAFVAPNPTSYPHPK